MRVRITVYDAKDSTVFSAYLLFSHYFEIDALHRRMGLLVET